MEKRKRVFGFFKDFIPYYRQLHPLTKSVLSSILAARLEFWFERYPDGFYKFLEPAPDHKDYREGNSWTEELGFSAWEFNSAFDKIGVTYPCRKDFEAAEDKFSKTITEQEYKIEKIIDQKTGKTRVHRIKDKGNESVFEVEMFYCRYVDKKTNLTHYFKNYDRDILAEALEMNEALNDPDRETRFVRKESPNLTDPDRETRSVENGNADLTERENRSLGIENTGVLIYNKDNSKENTEDAPQDDSDSKQEFQERRTAQPQNSESLQDIETPAPSPESSAMPATESKTPISEPVSEFVSLPELEQMVLEHYDAAGKNAKAVHKKIAAADKEKPLTRAGLGAWLESQPTIWRWLESTIDGPPAKTAKRYEPRESAPSRKAAPAQYQAQPSSRTREFFLKKLIPLDVEVHGRQTVFYNPVEHDQLFKTAWESGWPEDEILRRLKVYWRSTNKFYVQEGYSLKWFVQNFGSFADIPAPDRIAMRYPKLTREYLDGPQ